ncbi:MAG: carbon-nitrogen family hydrolase [Phycisphaerales bacterium]
MTGTPPETGAAEAYRAHMRAHLLQYDIAWEDKDANHERVLQRVEKAAVHPGDLVVLPEMFDTGFSMRTEITASDPEKSVGFLKRLALEREAEVMASIALRRRDLEQPRDCVNRAFVIAPDGEIRAWCDKVHPFSYGRESERFVGGSGVTVVPVGGGEDHFGLCPIVCYDLRFPELFRLGVDRGAELFAVIANWPAPRTAHWRALCIARAIENQAYVLGLNRCGSDPKLPYAGGSLIVDPRGEVLVEAADEEAVLSVDLDLPGLRAWRDEFPALRDRRSWCIGPDCAGSADR